MTTVTLDGGPLTRSEVVEVAYGRADVVPDAKLTDRMSASRSVVENAVEAGQIIYGITTGFGALSNTAVDPDQAEALQVSLLRSHAGGVGDPLPDELVRGMLLLRARTLAQGYSGVRPALVERYLDLLQFGLLPVVPSQGSVGASGDLAPFAHLALPLIGEGFLKSAGKARPSSEVLQDHGLDPLVLGAKEGLALLNGTEGMLTFGVLGLHRAELLAQAADAAAACSVDALQASSRPFRAEVHQLRPHPGQGASAALIAALLVGSEIEAAHRDDFVHAVQDAYSLRCAPQVHGAVRDTNDFAATVFDRELGSVVDNPVVLPETAEIISAGNFHGQPLAFALDFLAIAVTELSSISERRTDRLLDPERSDGLPPFLAASPGVESGYMLAQYTAAALVAENRVLSHPASVESIPTSGSQEDHVSMGWGAGRKLWDVLENAERVVAIELLCAAQGLDYRAPRKPGEGVSRVHAAVRAQVPTLSSDRIIAPEIETVAEMIRTGEIATAAVPAK
ncbi:MAG: histidine ammonia-lyase [Acidimicrobiia bacterium]